MRPRRGSRGSSGSRKAVANNARGARTMSGRLVSSQAAARGDTAQDISATTAAIASNIPTPSIRRRWRSAFRTRYSGTDMQWRASLCHVGCRLTSRCVTSTAPSRNLQRSSHIAWGSRTCTFKVAQPLSPVYSGNYVSSAGLSRADSAKPVLAVRSGRKCRTGRSADLDSGRPHPNGYSMTRTVK